MVIKTRGEITKFSNLFEFLLKYTKKRIPNYLNLILLMLNFISYLISSKRSKRSEPIKNA